MAAVGFAGAGAAAFCTWNSLTLIPAKTRPAAVHVIRPSLPSANVSLARSLLGKSPSDLMQADRLARKAYRSSPLSAEALAVLAFIAEQRGNIKAAETLLDKAAVLTRHDSGANMARLRLAAQRGDAGAIAVDADVVLRTVPENPGIVEALVAEARNPTFAEALTKRLAMDPPWRLSFLQTLGSSPEAQQTAYSILSRLRATKSPPSSEEVSGYFTIGARSLSPALLHTQWIAVQGIDRKAAQAPIYDGAFNGKPGTPPFNWRLSSNPYVRTSLRTGANAAKDHGLRVHFRGENRTSFARQMLVLQPGTYRITLAGSSVAATETAKMELSIACIESAVQPLKWTVSLSRMKATQASSFSIPQQCSGQWLTLIALPNVLGMTAEYVISRVSIAPT